jgi:hypothetical protein
VEAHGISRGLLASKMKMPKGTFNNKISDLQPAYRFTEAEEGSLKSILRDMAADIEVVAGISFNRALETLVR